MGFVRTGRGLFAFLGMLVLILDSKTALRGAGMGLELCLKTVIPSLFPFFFLSNLLTAGMLGRQTALLGLLGKLWRIPPGGESLLVSALLGGYPAGAQSIHSAWKSGQLGKQEAGRLLCFCNNPGPAFLFGMVAPMFSEKKDAWLLWAVILLSGLTTAWMLPADPAPVSIREKTAGGASEALKSAIAAMGTVCGWVILFRILLSCLERWFLWMLPVTVQVFVCGLLELSNGCLALVNIPDPALRFVLCAGILSFGGLCITMQTASVSADLFSSEYCLMKGFQGILSGILAWISWKKPWILLVYLLVLGSVLWCFRQKTVAFPGAVMYNALRKKRRNDHAVP